jgi:hypothetical protein
MAQTEAKPYDRLQAMLDYKSPYEQPGHRDYEAALARSGTTCRMGEIHPFCTMK